MIYFLAFFLFNLWNADAGTITMSSQHTFQVHYEDQKLSFVGEEKITNRGNEQATEVSPTFALNELEWSEAPSTVSPNETHSWHVDQSFAFSGIKGIYPLFETINYSDVNGHAFTAALVHSIEIGYTDPTDRPLNQIPAIHLTLTFQKKGEIYVGEAQVENISLKPINADIDYFTSRELQIIQPHVRKLIEPRSSSHMNVDVKNMTGTLESSYPIYVIAQWQVQGFHMFSQASELIKLVPEDTSLSFLWGGILSFMGAALITTIFIWRLTRVPT